MSERKKLIKSWKTPLGKVLYTSTILWVIAFFAGAIYFNKLSEPIIVAGWIPVVLIWFHVLFFWGMIMSYLFFYKVGARKGL